MSIALELVWHEVKNLVYSIVNRYVRAANLEKEEAESVAHLAAVNAYYSYDPDRGTIETWIANHVRYAMQEMIRSRAQQKKYTTVSESTPDRRKPTFKLKELMEGVSQDAKRMIWLTLARPTTVELSIMMMGGENIINIRRAVKEVLRESGWTWKRITETFREIKEAL